MCLAKKQVIPEWFEFMVVIVLKMFRFSPFIQTLISFLCFGMVAMILFVLELYSQGLGASFINSTPHISISSEEHNDILHSICMMIEKQSGVTAVTPYISGTGVFRVESKPYPIIGRVKSTAEIEITGLTLDEFPFAIPFENTRSLRKSQFVNIYTSKELILAVLGSPNSAIINEAMANVFSPANPATEDNYAVYSIKYPNRLLTQIKILAVLKDLQDTPRMFVSQKTAKKILQTGQYSGIFMRLTDSIARDGDSLSEFKDNIRVLFQKKSGDYKKIETWQEGELRQQKIFMVFQIISVLVLGSILVLSIFSGVLGIFRTFVVKQKSITILMRLGTSKLKLFIIISVVNILALSSGFLISLFLIFAFRKFLSNYFLQGLRQIVYVQKVDLNWEPIINANLALLVGYVVLFVFALYYIISNKQPIKI